MTNYWLSNIDYQINKIKFINESSKSNDDYDDDDDNESPEDQDDPSSNLTPRQKMLYDKYEEVVEEYGKFNKSAKADGAHYAPAAANPFKEEGMICGNCVYFMGGGGCEIVSGTIESDAICKLWIIPENLIKVKK
jgi:hypothetical protein